MSLSVDLCDLCFVDKVLMKLFELVSFLSKLSIFFSYSDFPFELKVFSIFKLLGFVFILVFFASLFESVL